MEIPFKTGEISILCHVTYKFVHLIFKKPYKNGGHSKNIVLYLLYEILGQLSIVSKYDIKRPLRKKTVKYCILIIRKLGSREEDEVSGFFVISHLWMRVNFMLG